MTTSTINESGIVMGIDPGTIRCGVGVIIRRGNRFIHVGHTVAKATEGAPLAERLRDIAAQIDTMIDLHKPTVMAIEQAFFHRDPHAALMLGHARGVAMLLAARRNIEVFEYAPAMVKRSVVGTGKADKLQVSGMIRAILGITEVPPLDASDALAVAICHAGASAITARSIVPIPKPRPVKRSTPARIPGMPQRDK